MKGVDQIQMGQVNSAMQGDTEHRLASLAGDVKSTYSPDEATEIRKQAQKFEALFLKMMLDSMRKTVDKSDLFGDPNTPSSTIYNSMLDSEYAKIMSENGGLGLADMVSQHFGVSQVESRADTFTLPASGRISSHFGMRSHPISGRMQMHEGMDLAVPIGTPVKAASDGEVVFAGEKRGYGKVVVLSHRDGLQTVYGHLDSINVGVGDKVKGDQPIAHSGNTGVSTGPHLHFEILKGGRPVNPVDFMSLR